MKGKIMMRCAWVFLLSAGLALCPPIRAQAGGAGKGAGAPGTSGGAIHFDAGLHDELIAMSADDQRVRANPKMSRQEIGEMLRVDKAHETRMRAIIAGHGWPVMSLVGADGSQMAWLIVQHCSLEFEEECLPLLEHAVAAGEASGKNLAYLQDRMLMYQDKPQVYGTQFRDNELWQVEDPAHVDDRRRSVGLGPLADYIELMNRMYGRPSHPADTAAALTPVETVKAFVSALAGRDEARIRSLTLPNPGLPMLWADALTDEDKEELDRVAKDQLRVLKAGDSVPMEGGSMEVPAMFATGTTVLVYGKSMLFPFPVQLVDGIWKVNTGPLLAAREKERKKEEAGRAPNPSPGPNSAPATPPAGREPRLP